MITENIIEAWKRTVENEDSFLKVFEKANEMYTQSKSFAESFESIFERMRTLEKMLDSSEGELLNNIREEYTELDTLQNATFDNLCQSLSTLNQYVSENSSYFKDIDHFIEGGNIDELFPKRLSQTAYSSDLFPPLKNTCQTYINAIKNNIPSLFVNANLDDSRGFAVEKGIYSIEKKDDLYIPIMLSDSGKILRSTNVSSKSPSDIRRKISNTFAKGKYAEPCFLNYNDFIKLSAYARLGLKEEFLLFKKQKSSDVMKTISVSQDEKMEKLNNMLKDGVKDIAQSGKFKEYLNVMSNFHDYSIDNCILIAMQKPQATLCAGRQTWFATGRNVKSGEEGISIFAPLVRKMTDEEKKKQNIPIDKEEKILYGYKMVQTFDISQTEGAPLPKLCEELEGSVAQKDQILSALERLSGIKIEYEKIDNGAYGYFSPLQQRIVIKEGLSDLHTIKTAIHETAHSLFDNPQSSLFVADSRRMDKEVRAESVAYMVCKQLGIDTDDYSFGYVASWSVQNPESLEKNLPYIHKGMELIVKGLNKEIKLIPCKNDIRANLTAKSKEPLTKTANNFKSTNNAMGLTM